MNRPIQVKPADSESRGGTVFFSFLSSPLFFLCYLLLSPFVLALQTYCLCVSASPLSVPLHDALYLDAGWQRGLAGPSSIQNTLCKQRSSSPASASMASSSFLGVSSYALMHAHAHVYTQTRILSCLRGKQVTILSNTFNNALYNLANPIWLMS